jgi:hypothetical protein
MGGQYLSRWWIIHPSFLTRLTDTLDGPYSTFSEGNGPSSSF